MSAYADDVLMASSARNLDMIVTALQQEVDNVAAWSVMAR